MDVCALSSHKILTADSLPTNNPATRSIANTWIGLPWNSFPFLETLVNLAAIEPADDAKQLLDIASRQATELVVFGLVEIPVSRVVRRASFFFSFAKATVEPSAC